MGIQQVDEQNLQSVTSATDGSSVDVSDVDKVTVYVNVSVNTGAVTVNIEASPTGAFSGEEVTLDSKTYTATTGTDVFTYEGYLMYVRTTTTTQSKSTVSTHVIGYGTS